MIQEEAPDSMNFGSADRPEHWLLDPVDRTREGDSGRYGVPARFQNNITPR